MLHLFTSFTLFFLTMCLVCFAHSRNLYTFSFCYQIRTFYNKLLDYESTITLIIYYFLIKCFNIYIYNTFMYNYRKARMLKSIMHFINYNCNKIVKHYSKINNFNLSNSKRKEHKLLHNILNNCYNSLILQSEYIFL